MIERKRLRDILIKEKLIDEKQLAHALEEQRKSPQSLSEILINKSFISSQDLGKALEIQLGVPYISLKNRKIDAKTVHIFPEAIIRRYKAIPVEERNGYLDVAMINPSDLSIIDELKLLSGYKIKPMITTQKEINEVIKYYFDTKKSVLETFKGLRRERGVKVKTAEEIEPQPHRVEEGSVIRTVNSMIAGALADKSSDIHIEPRLKDVRIRYRIDGMLYDVMFLPKHLQMPIISRLKILAKMNIAEQRRPQDGRFASNIEGKDINFRLSTIPTVHGEKMEIRILDKESMMLGLEELGLSSEEEELVTPLIHQPYGMILNTGPTGCGKTTTLYAILNQISKPEFNIITIEDPIEYELEGINQVQINPRAGITFATGLRSFLRQDPDIIMVGEIRDKETAQIAIQAALTGHLVFSTLHTGDAPGAIARLIDMGVERFLIAASLIGVIAQRLVRTVCPICKRENYSSRELERLKKGFNIDSNIPDTKINQDKGKGCTYCHNSGYRGRTGLFEVLSLYEQHTFVKEFITAQDTGPIAFREASLDAGMKTLRQSGLEKVIQGRTTLEEVARVTEESIAVVVKKKKSVVP